MAIESFRDELRQLLGELIGVTGILVATVDGLVIAAAADDVEADTVAALGAATAGVGNQFAATLSLGGASGTVIQGANGCVAVYPIGDLALLVLYGTDGPNVARLHLAVRQAMPRIEAALSATPVV
jgi:predicted regulator of Ras-like GTPase activity (Roadblock/LC7/MglB family)